jgi:hypothetical protein
MIRISCTNCKTVLSIDDAFAGGVCRCQHCGTIQTVPAQSRDAARAGAVGQSIGGSKSLYQAGGRGGVESGSGLDELAGIVVSSGLQSSRLTRSGNGAGERGRRQNLMPLIISATVILAVLLVIIIIQLSRNGGAASQGSGANGPGGSVVNAPVIAANTPSFCGTPLEGDTIIYLLDCGSSSGGYLGDLKDAAIKSLQTLGPDRKFQILFWNNGTDGAYPQETTTYASKENISAAQKAIDDVAPFGQSDIQAALKLAIAQKPDTLIIATGKGWDLDNAWLDAVMTTRGQSAVKIDTYSLLSNGESAPLKKLAAQTGGSYHELDAGQLNSFGR